MPSPGYQSIPPYVPPSYNESETSDNSSDTSDNSPHTRVNRSDTRDGYAWLKELTNLCKRVRFGTRVFSASPSPINDVYKNVVRLHIEPGFLVRVVAVVIRWLLSSETRDAVQERLPEWFLPSTIICKRFQVGLEEEYANEKAIYEKLRPIQGTVVPRCYGEARLADGSPALLLSDIGGHTLNSAAAEGIPKDAFLRLIDDAHAALAECGVLQGDERMENIHLVCDEQGRNARFMMLDFEYADAVSVRRAKKKVSLGAWHLWSFYKDLAPRAGARKDGSHRAHMLAEDRN